MMEDNLREDIVNAIAETKEEKPEVEIKDQTVETDVNATSSDRDEKGRFRAKQEESKTQETVVEQPKVEIEAPNSLTSPIKAKWKDLPEDVRQEWSKREADIHKMMTSHEGELRLGREIKDVVLPYMPIIQAEGGTPATAVRDLLNTAYLLRTGTPQQKTQLLHQVAQQYGVDLGQLHHQDPNNQLQQLQNEIAELRKAANPQALYQQLQEQTEKEKIASEVNAFKSDPSNKHYEQVKAQMAALLGSGAAANIKEAYDKACWADTVIRSTLLAEQNSAEQAKRKAEVEAKKKAASSITGSPGITVPNSGAPDRSLRDELRANIRAASS